MDTSEKAMNCGQKEKVKSFEVHGAFRLGDGAFREVVTHSDL
jgi:hypothetical protein